MSGAGESLSISVVITAMNEEQNIAPSVQSAAAALAPRGWDYEIIVVDDGSTDRTAEVADALAAADAHIRVHRHGKNLGLDRAYLTGIELAAKEYISWIAGNNMIPQQALVAIYDRIGSADLILSYPLEDPRRKRRRWISRGFVFALNILFGVRLRYFTGPCVYKADAAKRLRTITHGSMIVPEIVVRLLKLGLSYVEVGLYPKPRTAGQTKTFRPSNILYVALSVWRLFVDVQVMGRAAEPLANQR